MLDALVLRRQELALSESQHRRRSSVRRVAAWATVDARWRASSAECARLRRAVAEAKKRAALPAGAAGGECQCWQSAQEGEAQGLCRHHCDLLGDCCDAFDFSFVTDINIHNIK